VLTPQVTALIRRSSPPTHQPPPAGRLAARPTATAAGGESDADADQLALPDTLAPPRTPSSAPAPPIYFPPRESLAISRLLVRQQPEARTRAHTQPRRNNNPAFRSMGAGKGVDGGGEAPEPVVLKMDLHCAGCAHKVKKAIKRVPGTFVRFLSAGDSFRPAWSSG
jgi:hypothetical protein